MNIFERLGAAFGHFFTGLFHADADAALKVIEQNSPLVNAAKPVIVDIQKLVPDTKVAITEARAQVKTLLSGHFSLSDAEQWLEQNLNLNVPDLLRAAAAKIIAKLPAANGFAGSAINLAIEFALQLLRVKVA